jgi:hypothetical protein
MAPQTNKLIVELGMMTFDLGTVRLILLRSVADSAHFHPVPTVSCDRIELMILQDIVEMAT